MLNEDGYHIGLQCSCDAGIPTKAGRFNQRTALSAQLVEVHCIRRAPPIGISFRAAAIRGARPSTYSTGTALDVSSTALRVVLLLELMGVARPRYRIIPDTDGERKS